MSSAPTGWVAKLSGGDLLRADEIVAAIQGPGLLVVMRIDGSLKAIADHIDASGIDSKANQVLLCGSRAPHPQVQIVLLRSTLIAISLNLDHNLEIHLEFHSRVSVPNALEVDEPTHLPVVLKRAFGKGLVDHVFGRKSFRPGGVELVVVQGVIGKTVRPRRQTRVPIRIVGSDEKSIMIKLGLHKAGDRSCGIRSKLNGAVLGA